MFAVSATDSRHRGDNETLEQGVDVILDLWHLDKLEDNDNTDH